MRIYNQLILSSFTIFFSRFSPLLTLADKKKLTAIFSLDFDPTCTRLATAGMDNKIRLWNVDPIRAQKNDKSPTKVSKNQKLLAVLVAHTGAVMCVRFSNGNGKRLVSGADDMVILIWEQNEETDSFYDNSLADKNQEFGGQSTTEQWRPTRRLTGHESDVVDVAWSPDNAYLASCGLDNQIFIWDGQTFDRLKKISEHTQFVKGLAFDPTGELLASQSDDRSMKIWKTSDWSLETSIHEPFENSQFSTYFRRPSWSPDGSGIVAVNAVNGNAPVASVISRKNWKSSLALVGHRAAIETVRFNHKLFKKNVHDQNSNSIDNDQPNSKEVSNSYITVCAAGSQDRSVSVWLGNQPAPVVVVDSLFDGNIMDLSWCNIKSTLPNDNATFIMLATCSYDGTIAVLNFTEEDFDGILMKDSDQDLLVNSWRTSPQNGINPISSQKNKILKKQKREWGVDQDNSNDSSDNEDCQILSEPRPNDKNSNKPNGDNLNFVPNKIPRLAQSSNQLALEEKFTSNKSNSKLPTPSTLNSLLPVSSISKNITSSIPENNFSDIFDIDTNKANVSQNNLTSQIDLKSNKNSQLQKSPIIDDKDLAPASQVVTLNEAGKKRVIPTFLRPLAGYTSTPKKSENNISASDKSQNLSSSGNISNISILQNLNSLDLKNELSKSIVSILAKSDNSTIGFGTASVVKALGYIGEQLNNLTKNQFALTKLDDLENSTNSVGLFNNTHLTPVKDKVTLNNKDNSSSSKKDNSINEIIILDDDNTNNNSQTRKIPIYNSAKKLPSLIIQNQILRKCKKTKKTVICKNPKNLKGIIIHKLSI
ncbi:Protein hir1 [Smittium culicis]|uniref:Protein HIR n=1 Tax=Smittium culicis TaxID=133412 RepID=A0A1R1X0G0_9FUNG|nr:Protein hir1 [Smittium culicis]